MVLRSLLTWHRLDQPEPGYTVIIGALARMPEVADANLSLLERQHLDHLHEVIVVFDQSRAACDVDLDQWLRKRHPDLPLRVIFYTPLQARVLGWIRWAWCYSWLSWCLGIAACRTRYALLHDLDAMLLREDIIEQRYEAIQSRGDEYVGRQFYNGNGIKPSDGLVVTFELMFDVQWVRRKFQPTDLFNHVGWHRGRRVEFDTFLDAQARAGRASTLAIDAEDMVHPSQVFCQYTEFEHRRRYVLPEKNNLPMLAYLFYLGGDGMALRNDTHAMRDCPVGEARLFDRPMDVTRLSHEHLDWLVQQVERVESVVAGELRPEVRAYFEALRQQLPFDRSDDDSGTDVAALPETSGKDDKRVRIPVEVSFSGGKNMATASKRGPAPAMPRTPTNQRVLLHGIAFDPITETECVEHVMSALADNRGGWIITSNLDHMRRARRDTQFRSMLTEADLVVADGMPVIWASRIQGTPLHERVAGSSLVSSLAASASAHGRSLFLLGGEPGIAEQAGQRLTMDYPELRIAGHFCPPIGFETDAEQMERLRHALRAAQPDIVYVALGSPKQEHLIRQLRTEWPGTWWIGVGISLSFLSGRIKRAPRIVQRLGLEWVHRLQQEPRRLARRYLVDGLPFAGQLFCAAAIHRVRGWCKADMRLDRDEPTTASAGSTEGAAQAGE